MLPILLFDWPEHTTWSELIVGTSQSRELMQTMTACVKRFVVSLQASDPEWKEIGKNRNISSY